jgi:hypothetical protein
MQWCSIEKKAKNSWKLNLTIYQSNLKLIRKIIITKEFLFADKKRVFYTLDAFKSKFSSQI